MSVTNEAVSVGRRVAELRKQRGYTQRELAEKLKIPSTLMTDYERGKLRIHGELLRKLSAVLEVSADEILDLKTENRPAAKPSLRFTRRLNKIESLPSTKQKALLQIIDGFLKGEGA